MHILVLFAFGLLLVLALRPRRSNEEACNAHIARLTEGRTEPIVSFVAEMNHSAGKDFWTASQGVRGAIRRVYDLRSVLGVLHLCHKQGLVDTADALDVVKFAIFQAAYTVIALPEAAACAAFSTMPHLAALGAASYHWKATVETLALCQVSGSPPCLHGPRALL